MWLVEPGISLPVKTSHNGWCKHGTSPVYILVTGATGPGAGTSCITFLAASKLSLATFLCLQHYASLSSLEVPGKA
jgi:hypothetical protein